MGHLKPQALWRSTVMVSGLCSRLVTDTCSVPGRKRRRSGLYVVDAATRLYENCCIDPSGRVTCRFIRCVIGVGCVCI